MSVTRLRVDASTVAVCGSKDSMLIGPHRYHDTWLTGMFANGQRYHAQAEERQHRQAATQRRESETIDNPAHDRSGYRLRQCETERQDGRRKGSAFLAEDVDGHHV